jgi:putative ABC transport system permease protein
MTTHFVLAMAWRDGRAAGRRLLLLTAAISIGVGALVAIESFTDNLRTAVGQQSRILLGADVRMTSRNSPTPLLTQLVDSVARAAGTGDSDLSQVTSFAAMAYVTRTTGAHMVRATAIAGGYPFYGSVKTSPAGQWQRLQAGKFAVVDPAFLTGLGAQVGDTLALGEARFTILASVTNFPGDVGIQTAFGPRVFISARYLAETALLGFGARAEYEWYLRLLPGGDAVGLAKTWRPRLEKEQGGLRTAEDDERDLKRFLDQLGRYLGLVAVIALLLGGIGVASAVRVFLRQKRESIAVLRCLGASSRTIFAIYLLQAGIMGLIGSLVGVVLGMLLQYALPQIFGQFLPLDVAVHPSFAAIAVGMGVGLWVTLAFALLPLLGVRRIAPLVVLRQPFEETAGPRADVWTWLARLLLGASVVGLSMLQAGEVRKGIFFAAGVGGALLVLWLSALGMIRGLRRWFPRRLPYVWRQGLANLYRPANQTVAVVLALGFGAFLLGALTLSQHTLLRQLQLDSGVGRPNLVFFDVQPDQREGVETMLRDEKLAFQPAVPIVPMKIRAINGRPVGELLNDSMPKTRDGDRIEKWTLRREYRSTYRDSTVGSEKVVLGSWWSPVRDSAVRRSDGSSIQPEPGTQSTNRRTNEPTNLVPISLETGLAGDLGVTVGDTIVWDVQGVAVNTRVMNLREVKWARFEPNFFVVFPSGPLDQAPQSLVLLTRLLDPARMGALQRRIVERYSNVTSIDLSSIQQTIERIVSSVVLAIRFMALLSLATGLVVLIGALATSRFQRIREAVLLKTLGATRRQVNRIMLAEYAALGLLSALVAVALATAAGWALTKYVFEVPFSMPWIEFALLVIGMVLLTVLTGLWTGADVFRRTPLEVLRAE